MRIAGELEKYLGTPQPAKRRAKPLDMLIATLLSQNTNDKNSHRAYIQLRKSFRTWEQIAKAPWQKIASAIRVGGMANQKSKRIKSILQSIYEKHGSYDIDFLRKKSNDEVFEILLSLDGIGIKTAACVLVFSFGRDVFPVDTHIHRICGRLGLAPNCKTPEQTFEWMKPLVPKGKAYSFHTNLIRFGRKVCRAGRPLCSVCPIYKDCRFAEKEIYKKMNPNIKRDQNYNFMLLDNV